MQKTNMEKEIEIVAFNVATQEDENALISVDTNGEFIIKFADESFFRLPGDMTSKEIKDYLIVHKESNIGQIPAVDNEKKIIEMKSVLSEL